MMKVQSAAATAFDAWQTKPGATVVAERQRKLTVNVVKFAVEMALNGSTL